MTTDLRFDAMPVMEWPAYRCLEVEVRASGILGIDKAMFGEIYLILEHDRVQVDSEFMQEHDPQVGDYLMVFEDDSVKCRSAGLFDAGYTLRVSTYAAYAPHLGFAQCSNATGPPCPSS